MTWSGMNDSRQEREQEAHELGLIEAGLLVNPWGASLQALSCGLSDYVPPMLYEAWVSGRLPEEDLGLALRAVWVHNKSPLRGLGERKWLQMFKAAGFVVASVEVKRGDAEIPTNFEHLSASRRIPSKSGEGPNCVPTAAACRGLFTVTAPESLPKGGPTCISAHRVSFVPSIPPSAVLALYGDEREQEVVVNPHMLRGRVALGGASRAGLGGDRASASEAGPRLWGAPSTPERPRTPSVSRSQPF